MMKATVIVTICAIISVTLAAYPDDLCPRVDGPDSVYLVHEDCDKFYQCSNGKAYEMPCAPGTLWNPNLNVCDHPWNVDCDNRGPTTTTTTTTTEEPLEGSGDEGSGDEPATPDNDNDNNNNNDWWSSEESASKESADSKSDGSDDDSSDESREFRKEALLKYF